MILRSVETPLNSYAAFAQQLYDTCIISDPWIEGRERFRLEPVILSNETYHRLCTAAEAIGQVYEELCELVWAHPEWLDEFFHLTPYQKLMWLSSEGRWHGIARLDLFLLPDGTIQMCEMNSDTPSGEAETVVLNQLCHPRYPNTKNPNERFAEQFYAMVMESYQASCGESKKPVLTVGIVYPTEMPEDLSMITLYQQWFEERGCRVILGSPYNLHRLPSGELALFDSPIDVLLRHYKTDWWGERFPVWSDADDFPDSEPLDVQLRYVLEAELANRVVVVNPFGAVLTQNKLTMAFCWSSIALFSPEAQQTIRSYIPETHRLCDVAATSWNKTDWVLKSDYGCEGDEVVLGRFVSDEIWNVSLAAALPEHWIIQRFFDAQPFEGDLIPNYGVYLLGGEACGIYTRLSAQATDYTAVTAPTFVV
jgi:glutathionylspermidine synthase